MANTKPKQDTKTRINIRNCVFGFRCAQNWEAMKETSRDGVRFCDECGKDVYWITNKESLMEAISLNRCIAIEVPREQGTPREQAREIMVGMRVSYEEKHGKPEPNAAYRERLRDKKIT